MLGDTITRGKIPCTQQLINVYRKYNSSAISVEKVPQNKIERYGIIDGNQVENNVYEINNLVEKPSIKEAPSNLAIMGRYLLTSNIFEAIEETQPGKGGEIQLTDALSKLNKVYGAVYDGKSYDIGNRLEWLETSLKFAMDDPEAKDDLTNYIKNDLFKNND